MYDGNRNKSNGSNSVESGVVIAIFLYVINCQKNKDSCKNNSKNWMFGIRLEDFI